MLLRPFGKRYSSSKNRSEETKGLEKEVRALRKVNATLQRDLSSIKKTRGYGEGGEEEETCSGLRLFSPLPDGGIYHPLPQR